MYVGQLSGLKVLQNRKGQLLVNHAQTKPRTTRELHKAETPQHTIESDERRKHVSFAKRSGARRSGAPSSPWQPKHATHSSLDGDRQPRVFRRPENYCREGTRSRSHTHLEG